MVFLQCSPVHKDGTKCYSWKQNRKQERNKSDFSDKAFFRALSPCIILDVPWAHGACGLFYRFSSFRLRGFFHPLCVEQEIFTNHLPMKFSIHTFACYINFVWERENGLRLRILLLQLFDPTIAENSSFSFQKEEKKKEQNPEQFKDTEFKMEWKFNQNHSVFPLIYNKVFLDKTVLCSFIWQISFYEYDILELCIRNYTFLKTQL